MRHAICLAGLSLLMLASAANADDYLAERNAYFSSVPANSPLRSRPPAPACSPSYRATYYAPPSGGSPYGPALYQNQVVPEYRSNSYYTPGNYVPAPTGPRFFWLPR